jgi:uncharacterized peroxidase-related enzyme
MPRIAALSIDNAGAARPILEAVKGKLGMVPNIIGTIANSPAALKGYLSLSEALNGGTLNAGQRESVALAIAQTNACGYCLSAHTLMAKGAGLGQDEIAAARRGDANALVRFARLVTSTRGELTPDEIKEARVAGLSDEQIIEVIAHVALNTLTNYVNHIAGTEIDFPVVTA